MTNGDSTTALLDTAEVLALYRTALLIRVSDDRMLKEVQAGQIEGATYPVHGLEGVCAALGHGLKVSDMVVSTYRNLGDALAKGVPLVGIVAEMAGRTAGVARGRGGAMHIADTTVGFMTTTGIVGSGLPIANGLALATQMRSRDDVTVATFGDGATSIGAFHEALNLATLWKLPVLFVCQNNGWGEHTPIDQYMANTDIAGRAASYGLVAERVDGFDAIATLLAVRRAVDAIRRGEGPRFLEAVTYRLSGHTSVTDYSYMPTEELAAHRAGDAITRLEAELVARGAKGRLATIRSEVEADVDDGFARALASPYPPMSEAHFDVVATSPTYTVEESSRA